MSILSQILKIVPTKISVPNILIYESLFQPLSLNKEHTGKKLAWISEDNRCLTLLMFAVSLSALTRRHNRSKLLSQLTAEILTFTSWLSAALASNSDQFWCYKSSQLCSVVVFLRRSTSWFYTAYRLFMNTLMSFFLCSHTFKNTL